MAAILYRQFSEGSRPFLTLAGEDYVRQISMGYDWSAVRIIMSCAIGGAQVSVLNNVRFFIGLCSGANGFYMPNCTWAVGASTVYNNRSNAPYAAGPPPHYQVGYASANNTNGVQATDGVLLTAQINVVGSVRSFVAVYITTSGNNLLPSPTTPASVSAADWDFTAVAAYSDFTSRIPTAIVAGVSVPITGNQGGSPKYATPPLDSLNIYWNKTQNPLEIYSIVVTRCA